MDLNGMSVGEPHTPKREPSGRRWYTEPETFIAVAALIVSVSAVVVGIYEAKLQRDHDKAEVWPHVELSTWISNKGASLKISNTGIGPAIVHSIQVTVDGKPYQNWNQVVDTIFKHHVQQVENSTVAEHALRGGDVVTLVGVPQADLPKKGFYDVVRRIGVTVCYSSVFGESWVIQETVGASSTWHSVDTCGSQPAHVDF